jgi:hypothetical protein
VAAADARPAAASFEPLAPSGIGRRNGTKNATEAAAAIAIKPLIVAPVMMVNSRMLIAVRDNAWEQELNPATVTTRLPGEAGRE